MSCSFTLDATPLTSAGTNVPSARNTYTVLRVRMHGASEKSKGSRADVCEILFGESLERSRVHKWTRQLTLNRLPFAPRARTRSVSSSRNRENRNSNTRYLSFRSIIKSARYRKQSETLGTLDANRLWWSMVLTVLETLRLWVRHKGQANVLCESIRLKNGQMTQKCNH